MKSKIKILADYTQAEFPREIDLRCPEEFIQKKTRAVTRSGKRRSAVSVLEKGDTAVLSLASELPRFNRSMVPVAVGSGLYDKELEEQLVGRAVGETFTAQVQETAVAVTVEQATRIVFPELTDELVAAYAASQEGMKDIKTVADFHRWVNEQYKEEKRQDAYFEGIRACREYVLTHSAWEFDESELSAFIERNRDYQRESMKQRTGLDYDAASDEDFNQVFGKSRQQMELMFRQWAEKDLATILWNVAARGVDPDHVEQEKLGELNWDFLEKYISGQLTYIN